MAKSLGCFPSFDDMDFYEFMSKYEKLKNRLKEEKKNGMSAVDFLSQFKSILNG
jgi:hypothetical protein